MSPLRQKKNFLRSPWFFVAGAVLGIIFSVNLTRAYLKDRGIRAEISRLQQEAEELERAQKRDQELLNLLQNPDFLEEEARATLGYVQPGEQVVIIEPQSQRQREPPASQISNPRKWWRYFFGGS